MNHVPQSCYGRGEVVTVIIGERRVGRPANRIAVRERAETGGPRDVGVEAVRPTAIVGVAIHAGKAALVIVVADVLLRDHEGFAGTVEDVGVLDQSGDISRHDAVLLAGRGIGG